MRLRDRKTNVSLTKIIIQPSQGWNSLGLRDLWEYRELLFFTIFREIQGRYRQTALGVTWLFLRPILNVLILSLVFGYIVNVPSDGLPYPLFSMSAILPWSYFSQAAQRASGSLVENMRLISKVYFPRMIIPLAAVLSGLVDFGASFIVYLIVQFIYRYPFSWNILYLPLFVLVSVLFALAVGLWLANLSVKYRDVNFAVVFLIQALMYLSPVIYPVSAVPEKIQPIYLLNPMTGVIQGFRWALLGSGTPPDMMFGISVIITLVLLISGAFVFRRTERKVVDLL